MCKYICLCKYVYIYIYIFRVYAKLAATVHAIDALQAATFARISAMTFAADHTGALLSGSSDLQKKEHEICSDVHHFQ